MTYPNPRTMEEEVWKDIPGYEGLYQASTLGRIKSLIGKKIILKFGIRRGYYVVSFRKNNILKTSSVHQLIVMTFKDHIPDGHKSVVDHVDGNKLNNRLDNLNITTQRQNVVKGKWCTKGKTSKYIGVFFNKQRNKWKSVIGINGQSKYLGLFNTEEKASAAYQEALTKINNNEL